MKIFIVSGKEVLVSDEDFSRILSTKLKLRLRGKKNYVILGGKNRYLHQFIIGEAPAGFHIDHIDRNPLNNQRENLRIVSPSANQHNAGLSAHNTSGFRGVSFHRKTAKWSADIRLHKHRIHIGLFATPEAASSAYQAFKTLYKLEC